MVNVGNLGWLLLALAAPMGVSCSCYVCTSARMRTPCSRDARTCPHCGLSVGATVAAIPLPVFFALLPTHYSTLGFGYLVGCSTRVGCDSWLAISWVWPEPLPPGSGPAESPPPQNRGGGICDHVIPLRGVGTCLSHVLWIT